MDRAGEGEVTCISPASSGVCLREQYLLRKVVTGAEDPKVLAFRPRERRKRKSTPWWPSTLSHPPTSLQVRQHRGPGATRRCSSTGPWIRE